MIEVRLLLEPAVICFYSKVAENTGLSLEQVLADTLFKLAGELALEAIKGQP